MDRTLAGLYTLIVLIVIIAIGLLITWTGKRYGQKLVDRKIITVEEFYEVGYIGWFFIMIFGI